MNKVLLHACCGPCSTHTLKVLEDYFDITIYFDNSNMDTEEEGYLMVSCCGGRRMRMYLPPS